MLIPNAFIYWIFAYLLDTTLESFLKKKSLDSLVLESFFSVNQASVEKNVISRALEIVASLVIFGVVSDVDMSLKSNRNRIIRIILSEKYDLVVYHTKCWYNL